MKSRSFNFILTGLVFCTAAILLAQTPKEKSRDKVVDKKSVVHEDAGEKAFQANCSRCHYAPEQLSPRISGTVLRHMRVRASLSAKDEELILHYLAP